MVIQFREERHYPIPPADVLCDYSLL